VPVLAVSGKPVEPGLTVKRGTTFTVTAGNGIGRDVGRDLAAINVTPGADYDGRRTSRRPVLGGRISECHRVA
jgi:hypothetical protein